MWGGSGRSREMKNCNQDILYEKIISINRKQKLIKNQIIYGIYKPMSSVLHVYIHTGNIQYENNEKL